MFEVEQELMNEIMNQYNKREKYESKNYHIHPNYLCECMICSQQKMTDNQIKKDIELDPFYDDSSIHDLSELQESFVHQFKVINNMLDKKKTLVEHKSIINIEDPVDFLSLTLKLMQPNKNGKILNMRVMDTLFFYQREPCVLVYNDKDKGLKVIKEKNLLSNMLELRNFFINRRFQYDIEVRTQTEKRNTPSFNSLEFDQKSAEIQQLIKKETQKIPISTKDFLLVKFRNGGMQIMTQLETMQLFDKRRIDQIWDQIIYIQAFPYDLKGLLTLNKKQDTDSRFKHIQFEKDKIKYQQLFDKALEHVCLINNSNYWNANNQREYERYLKTLKQNLDEYLNFMVYQIVHFFEAFHKRKILKVRVDFAQDDFNEYHIFDSSYLQIVDVQKIKWNEMILKEISVINTDFQEQVQVEINQATLQKQESLRNNEKSVNSQRLKFLGQAMNEINEYLRTEYLKKIEEAEVELQNQGDVDKTNQIFKTLNPKSTKKFSYLIEIQKDDELLMKKDLLGNFPIDKQRYLGQQNYKIESKQMQFKRELYKRQLKSPKQVILPPTKPYSISAKGNKTYLFKKSQLKSEYSTQNLEAKTDDIQNYYSKLNTQSQTKFSDYKY